MLYAYKVDDIIIKILDGLNKQAKSEDDQCNKIGFNKLFEEIALQHKAISKDVLSDHLTRMEKEQIVCRDPFKPGIERYCWLHDHTIWALKIGWPIRVTSAREVKDGLAAHRIYELNKKNKTKKAHLLLIALANSGFPRETPSGLFDVEFNREEYPIIMLPGVSVDDFFHKYRKSNVGLPFNYLDFRSESEVKSYFEILKGYDPPLIKRIEEIDWMRKELLQKHWKLEFKGETRYGIADKKLDDFLIELSVLQGEVHTAVPYVLSYLEQKRKQEPEVRAWFEYVYGSKYTQDFFSCIRQNKRKFKSGTKEERKKSIDHAKSVSRSCILNAYFIYGNLIGKKYEDLRKPYGLIIKWLLEISYPDFFNEIVKKEFEKEQKTKPPIG